MDLLKSKKRKHYLSQLTYFFSTETDKIPDQNISKSLEEKQSLAKLHIQLNRLPEKQLTVIVLNKLEGILYSKPIVLSNEEKVDISSKLIHTTSLLAGSTIVYFDTRTLYNGMYLLRFPKGSETITKKLMIQK